jgi:ligand-binding sensor domain-containing protein/signal transduction histidine kinase
LRNLNTFRDRRPKPAWLRKALVAGLALVFFSYAAEALSSNKAISQYLHDQWTGERGFPGGPVYTFAQTPDGYLWIGTGRGLVRFDGISFQLFEHSENPLLYDGPVLGLAVDAEGALWVRLGPTLLRYWNGKFQDIALSQKTSESRFTAMCAGKNGDILFASQDNGVVRYSQGTFATVVPAAEVPTLIISMAVAPDGTVWMGTREQGLYYLKDGPLSNIMKGLPDKKVNALLPVSDHEIWASTDNGLVRWNGSELSQAGVPRALEHIPASVLIKDRDSNIWVGASDGLVRIDSRGVSSRVPDQNLATEAVNALFEDREGNLWVGTRRGIERFRDSAFTTYLAADGLPSDSTGPLYVDTQERIWFGGAEGGLYWLKDGRVGRVTEAGLDRDVVYSIDGRKNELWIGRRLGGLTQLKFESEPFRVTTYTQVKGMPQNSVYAVHENRDGTVWAGTLNSGLAGLQNSGIQIYTVKNGLRSNSISSVLEGLDGTMWVGTPNGLSALSNGQWRAYTTREGLPPGNVNCLFEDRDGVLWIGTANGLAFLHSGTIQIPRGLPDALREEVLGIEEDKSGSLWVATANHILQVDRAGLLRGEMGTSEVREYGLTDGLSSRQGVRRQRSVVADDLGRIWFSTNRGLSFVDPGSSTWVSAPAIVHIEGVSADGRPVDLGKRVRIATPHQRITLNYTGVSLAAPARVRFKYRLEPYDQDWSEPTTTRRADYTNLDPGPYRFSVMASNSEGLWNGSEATLQFEIERAFWQTWWFRSLCVGILVIFALAYLRLRVVLLTKQLNMRFDERLAERTRIAQELHDTLLQGFLSASMQLHVAADHLPPDSPAKPLINRVLELMSKVTDEGRNVLRGLRSTQRSSLDLEQAFSQIRQEFPVQSQIGFRVIVEGTARPLRPIIRDEVYLIGREALSNAFRHSNASEIEVELEYAAHHLRVLVRDNGGGIDPEVLRAGREGHWGLSGMKERTGRIGGRLRVLSREAAGTEVELSVPGQIAFEVRSGNGVAGWLAKSAQ